MPLTARVRTSRLALISAAVVVLACGDTLFSARRPARTFRLKFQLADFVVPASETWRLSWKSPYHPGDIRPAYDVRVTEGEASLGKNREIYASAYDWRPGKTGLLDLWATRGEAIAWLEPGTRFSTANDLLKIEVGIFLNNP